MSQDRAYPGFIRNLPVTIPDKFRIKATKMAVELKLLAPESSEYPAALRSGPAGLALRPISAIGPVSLLRQRLLGFFCSARCPGEAILQTYDMARALRDAGIPMIGGFHSPMEKE